MQITTKDNHNYVIADEGNYVGLKDRSVFGEALSLGINVTIDDVIEEPIDDFPKPEEMPEFETETAQIDAI